MKQNIFSIRSSRLSSRIFCLVSCESYWSLGSPPRYFLIWTFQANYEEMMSRYKQLLMYIKTAVTRNYSEKSINSILDYISTSKQVLSSFYSTLPLSGLPFFPFPYLYSMLHVNFIKVVSTLTTTSLSLRPPVCLPVLGIVELSNCWPAGFAGLAQPVG